MNNCERIANERTKVIKLLHIRFYVRTAGTYNCKNVTLTCLLVSLIKNHGLFASYNNVNMTWYR